MASIKQLGFSPFALGRARQYAFQRQRVGSLGVAFDERTGRPRGVGVVYDIRTGRPMGFGGMGLVDQQDFQIQQQVPVSDATRAAIQRAERVQLLNNPAFNNSNGTMGETPWYKTTTAKVVGVSAAAALAVVILL